MPPELPAEVRTPVRKKAARYEAALLDLKPRKPTPKRKGRLGGQGRPPSPLTETSGGKQLRLTAFILNKSPKAAQAREKARKLTPEGQSQETADMELNTITRGPKASFGG